MANGSRRRLGAGLESVLVLRVVDPGRAALLVKGKLAGVTRPVVGSVRHLLDRVSTFDAVLRLEPSDLCVNLGCRNVPAANRDGGHTCPWAELLTAWLLLLTSLPRGSRQRIMMTGWPLIEAPTTQNPENESLSGKLRMSYLRGAAATKSVLKGAESLQGGG